MQQHLPLNGRCQLSVGSQSDRNFRVRDGPRAHARCFGSMERSLRTLWTVVLSVLLDVIATAPNSAATLLWTSPSTSNRGNMLSGGFRIISAMGHDVDFQRLKTWRWANSLDHSTSYISGNPAIVFDGPSKSLFEPERSSRRSLLFRARSKVSVVRETLAARHELIVPFGNFIRLPEARKLMLNTPSYSSALGSSSRLLRYESLEGHHFRGEC